MAVKHQKWWKNMQPRRDLVAQKGRENDRAFLDTLGCMEQASWHEGRREVDPTHINPYYMVYRAKA